MNNLNLPEKEIPDLASIGRYINQPATPGLAPLRISILRNVTIEPIEPYLRYFTRKLGLDAQVTFGGFDSIVQDAFRNDALLNEATDVVLVFINFQYLSPDLSLQFARYTPAELDAEKSRILDYVAGVLHGVARRAPNAKVLFHSFERPLFPALGILENAGERGQLRWMAELNGELRLLLASTKNAYFVDQDNVLSLLGTSGFYDARYWHIGKAPYSRQGLAQIAKVCGKYIRAIQGRSYKCLVLDCDETLWGGTLDEDGINGIKLGPDYPGSPYYELQRTILNLYHRGVVLAVCSKNNHDDVIQVFRNHPFMLLREEHVTVFRVNWNDKARNIREIAAELNIGIDAIMFIDDSAFEIELVRSEMPEVLSVQLPKQAPHLYASTLMAFADFDTLSLSAEDRERNAMYRSECERKAVRRTLAPEEYLDSLGMRLAFELGNETNRARLSQQTLKTNQFNLTTRRYTEADIQGFIDSPEADVVGVRLADRFGDYGLVGTAILVHEGERVRIDTFLLSCRALSRGVEREFLVELLEWCASRGYRFVEAEYVRSNRNDQVRSFYEGHGFVKTGEDETGARYAVDLHHAPAFRRHERFVIETPLPRS